jgi:hypothetical protein
MSQPCYTREFDPAGQISNEPKLIVAPKSSPIACTVVDYSAGGACLQLFPMVTLPDRFALFYGNVRCRIV